MSHPVAITFLRRILAAPRDVVARMVFADWLEETGAAANLAWAKYLRLRAEAEAVDSSVLRELVLHHAAQVESEVVAELALPARRFVPEFSTFLNLLPGRNFALRVGGFPPPRRLVQAVPYSCFRRHTAVPLGAEDGRVVVGMPDPRDAEAVAAFDRVFGVVVPVRACREELAAAAEAVYHPVRVARIDDEPRDDPASRPEEAPALPPTAADVRAYLEQLIAAARGRAANGVEITAYEKYHQVRIVLNGRPQRWLAVEPDLGRDLVWAARALPARRLRVVVRPRDTYYGPGVRIALLS